MRFVREPEASPTATFLGLALIVVPALAMVCTLALSATHVALLGGLPDSERIAAAWAAIYGFYVIREYRTVGEKLAAGYWALWVLAYIFVGSMYFFR